MKVLRFSDAFLFFFALLAVLWWLMPIPNTLIESVYSRGLFRFVATVLIPLSDWLPISSAGLMLAFTPIALIIFFWRRRKKIRFSSWQIWWRVPLVLLALYGVFVLCWGANYRRLSIEKLYGLETQKVQASNLEAVVTDLLLVLQTNADAPREAAQALAAIRQAISSEVTKITGSTPTLPTRVKSTPAGLLLILKTVGVVAPWTLEAHVDAALPEAIRLAVAAHELVHTTGFAGEADTDFVAVLAGLQADNAYAKYAVALLYFAKTIGDIPRQQQEKLIQQLPKQAFEDFAALRKANATYSLPLIGELSQLLYGNYLQSQGVKAGIGDYSRIGRLLAAAKRQGLFNP